MKLPVGERVEVTERGLKANESYNPLEEKRVSWERIIPALRKTRLFRGNVPN